MVDVFFFQNQSVFALADECLISIANLPLCKDNELFVLDICGSADKQSAADARTNAYMLIPM